MDVFYSVWWANEVNLAMLKTPEMAYESKYRMLFLFMY